MVMGGLKESASEVVLCRAAASRFFNKTGKSAAAEDAGVEVEILEISEGVDNARTVRAIVAFAPLKPADGFSKFFLEW